MDVKKRLLRKPVQTVLWQIILISMALLVGVGGSLAYASNRLTDVLDAHQTTIAAQTWYGVETQYGTQSLVNLTQEDIATLESLEMVEMVDLRTVTGAYIPSMTADIALARWGDLHAINWDNTAERGLNDPYNQIVVTGTVENSWTITENDYRVYTDMSVLGLGSKLQSNYAYAILQVDEILVMNEEFDIFETEEWSSYCGKVFVQALVYDETGEDWFREGARYIVSGSYDPSCHGRGGTVMHTPNEVFLPWIEVNRAHTGGTQCVQEEDALVVYPDAQIIYPHSTIEGEDMIEVLASVGEPFPVVQKLEGTTEEFLAGHPEWQAWVDLYEMAQHTFTVLGTESLESVQYFVTNAASITQGRSFTREEYDTGAKVCVISETMAQSGGIQVGDTISVSQYLLGKSYGEGNWRIPRAYSDEEAKEPNVGVRPIPYGLTTENEEFTVVGIYRLERSWENHAYAFTPNTMFMPQRAQIPGGFGGPSTTEVESGMTICTDLQTGRTWEEESSWTVDYPNGCYGVYMSIKLKNGTMEDFQTAIAETNLASHRFLTYDQGFDKMNENIQAVIEAANKLLRTAAGGWFLLLILYMLLYQARERRTLGIMRSVGTKPGQARRYLFISGFAPAVLGISLGTALSGTVAKLVQDKLITLTLTQARASAHSGGMVLDNSQLAQMLGQSEITARGLLILALLQLAVIMVLLWLQAAVLARKNTRKLLGV